MKKFLLGVLAFLLVTAAHAQPVLTENLPQIAPGSFVLGTRAFSAGSPWNTPIGGGATYGGALAFPTVGSFNYNVGNEVVIDVPLASAPMVTVTAPAGWGWPANLGGVSIPIDVGVTKNPTGGDGQVIVIAGTTVWDLYFFTRTSDTTATAEAWAKTDIVTGTGFGQASPFLGAGTTASGSSQLAGIVLMSEIQAGAINHALGLILQASVCNGPTPIPPAINNDCMQSGGIAAQAQHLAIPPAAQMPNSLSPVGVMMWNALKTYGAYLIDNSSDSTNFRAQNTIPPGMVLAMVGDVQQIIPYLQIVTP